MFFSIFHKFLKTKYTFEGKASSEKTLTLVYRHWFVLLLELFAFFLLIFPPFVLYYFTAIYLANSGANNLFWFLTSVYFLFWWLGLNYRITMYLLDTWIVTNHRILNNEQHGFFSRTLSEMSLAKIQDTSVRLLGAIPTFLNYGDLEIQTAGTETKFSFKQIPNPRGVKNLIMQAHDKFVYEHKDNLELHRNLDL